MADGTHRPIEAIKPGDRLWSYNIDGGYQILPAIVSHIGTRLDWIYNVRVGSRGASRLRATGEHPVLTERGWILARQLIPGDRVLKVWYQNTMLQIRKLVCQSARNSGRFVCFSKAQHRNDVEIVKTAPGDTAFAVHLPRGGRVGDLA